ncbi:MAG TPA: hypothetical protein VGJ26_09130 [Pirellulales bacterium]
MPPLVAWRTCKRILLLFWAVWLTLVVATNLADAARAAGLIAADFPFASGNYATMLEVTAPVGVPVWATAGLFAGVIVWETASMLLFWIAALRYPNAEARRKLLPLTFTVGLSLWAAFQIACEAMPSPLAYQLAGTHRLLFTEQLATLLAIILLPDD